MLKPGNRLSNAQDPEDEQLIRALDRFKPGDIALLTRDSVLLDRNDPRILSPDQYCQRPAEARAMNFIDLKTQQDAIRPELEKGIHRVLHHGQYIMGPEVRELESRLAEYVGVKHAGSCSSGTDALLMALMVVSASLAPTWQEAACGKSLRMQVCAIVSSLTSIPQESPGKRADQTQ